MLIGRVSDLAKIFLFFSKVRTMPRRQLLFYKLLPAIELLSKSKSQPSTVLSLEMPQVEVVFCEHRLPGQKVLANFGIEFPLAIINKKPVPPHQAGTPVICYDRR